MQQVLTNLTTADNKVERSQSDTSGLRDQGEDSWIVQMQVQMIQNETSLSPK